MVLKSLWRSLFASILLVSCSRIEIRDIPVHVDAGADGAVIAHTMSENTSVISKQEWDAKRPGFFCVSAEDFGWLRATIEKLCGENRGMCRAEEKKKMAAFFARTREVQRRRANR